MLVREAGSEAVHVGFRDGGHDLDAELPTGPHDADGNLAAIGHQHAPDRPVVHNTGAQPCGIGIDSDRLHHECVFPK